MLEPSLNTNTDSSPMGFSICDGGRVSHTSEKKARMEASAKSEAERLSLSRIIYLSF
jgi:hypothetical protein